MSSPITKIQRDIPRASLSASALKTLRQSAVSLKIDENGGAEKLAAARAGCSSTALSGELAQIRAKINDGSHFLIVDDLHTETVSDFKALVSTFKNLLGSGTFAPISNLRIKRPADL